MKKIKITLHFPIFNLIVKRLKVLSDCVIIIFIIVSDIIIGKYHG